jgi:hypothetical protein
MEDLRTRYSSRKVEFSGNIKHLEILDEAFRRRSARVWQRWRAEYPTVRIDLRGINLAGRTMRRIDFAEARLDGATLARTDLRGANLERSSLKGARLMAAVLSDVHAAQADFRKARLDDATLRHGHFERAKFHGARLHHADLSEANFTRAKFPWAELDRADLTQPICDGADLSHAQLNNAILHRTSFLGAKLGGAMVAGASIRAVKVDKETDQHGLMVDVHVMMDRRSGPPVIFTEVDDIRLAQFHGAIEEYGSVARLIAAGTRRVVLILGRFLPRRKRVLERLADALRERGKIPVIFDFPGPEHREVSDTVRFVAGMSQFIIVDLTKAASVPLELQATIPDLMVPVLPIVQSGYPVFSMFADLRRRYPWVQPIARYENAAQLVRFVDEAIITRAENVYRSVEPDRKLYLSEDRLQASIRDKGFPLRVHNPGLLATHVRSVSFVFANVFEQLRVRHQFKRNLYGPRFGVCLGIVECELDLHVTEVGPPDALGDVQRIGVGIPAIVEPRAIRDADGFNDERISIPPSDGVPEP